MSQGFQRQLDRQLRVGFLGLLFGSQLIVVDRRQSKQPVHERVISGHFLHQLLHVGGGPALRISVRMHAAENIEMIVFRQVTQRADRRFEAFVCTQEAEDADRLVGLGNRDDRSEGVALGLLQNQRSCLQSRRKDNGWS